MKNITMDPFPTNDQIDLFYNSAFNENTAFDIENFDYPLDILSNRHLLDLSSSIFKYKLTALEKLPSWLIPIGMAKISCVTSNENLTLGEVISSGTLSDEVLYEWLQENENFFEAFYIISDDENIQESWRLYWDNLESYGDLKQYCSCESSFFKKQLKKTLEKLN